MGTLLAFQESFSSLNLAVKGVKICFRLTRSMGDMM